MDYEPEEILAEFGYTLKRSLLSLPQSTADLDRLDNLKIRIQESLPYISLTPRTAHCPLVARCGASRFHFLRPCLWI
jgi:hypothetical protein